MSIENYASCYVSGAISSLVCRFPPSPVFSRSQLIKASFFLQLDQADLTPLVNLIISFALLRPLDIECI